MLHTHDDRQALEQFISNAVANRPGPVLFRKNANEGQALIEYALMVPLLFVLIFNVVNFGGFLYGWITISNAARVGSQYAAMGGAYASYPQQATLAQIQTLIQNETASLPGASSTNPTVTVCENQNGTAVQYPPANPPAACPSSITAPPQDPEPINGSGGTGVPTYTTVAIDVTYTYPLLFPTFSIAKVGIAFPPTTIHRRTVMRVLN